MENIDKNGNSVIGLPIGTIIAVHYDLKQAYLPADDRWAYCGLDSNLPGWTGKPDKNTALPTAKFDNGRNVPDLEDDRFLTGGYAYERSGSNSHGLTMSNIPQHSHGLSGGVVNGGGHSHTLAIPSSTVSEGGFSISTITAAGSGTANSPVIPKGNRGGYTDPYVYAGEVSDHSHADTFSIDNAGQATPDAIDHRPKYFKVRYFIRIA